MVLMQDKRVHVNDGKIHQTDYPFRLSVGSSLIRVLLHIPLIFLVGTMTFGAPAMILMLVGIPLMPAAWHGTWALFTLLLYLWSLYAALHWRHVACYDKAQKEFVVYTQIFNHVFARHVWPLQIFKGVTYGTFSRHPPGGGPVVRLESLVAGFMVDNLFSGTAGQPVSEIAQLLSQEAGLPLLGQRNTRSQDELNDLRHNQWMVPRLMRKVEGRAQSVPTSLK